MNPFDSNTVENKNMKHQVADLFEWLRLDGHDYSILSAKFGTQLKQIVFSLKDCKYYTAARNEADENTFKQYAPYLRWAFDKIEAETKEVEVEEESLTAKGNKTIKKVKKQIPTGNFINKFPPTSENILLKKREVLERIYAEHTSPTKKQISQALSSIVPRLSDHESIQALMKAKGSASEAKLKRSFEKAYS